MVAVTPGASVTGAAVVMGALVGFTILDDLKREHWQGMLWFPFPK
jgi:hypothetical protein